MSASTPSTGPDPVHVAVAVVRNHHGEILITRRAGHTHQGGLWEFPGGKREPGETIRAALCRELKEELGVTVRSAEPLLQVRHRYPDCRVLLEVFEVNAFYGHPHGREGQPLVWVKPDQLGQYDFPAADHPILTAVNLPPWYAVLEGKKDEIAYRQCFDSLIKRELKLVYIRARDLSSVDYRKLVTRLISDAHSATATLMIRSDTPRSPLPGTGLHLSGAQLNRLEGRPSGWRWVGAACHSLDDLLRAENLGLDFAVLSPVRPTPTHCDSHPLGWETVRQWLSCVNLPVYLMGGLRVSDLTHVRNCGAHGIAGIRLFSD